MAGHRLLSEKVTRPHVRAGRPILIPSVPVSEGIEIRHGCKFLSSLIRALAKLSGGLGWVLSCSIGSRWHTEARHCATLFTMHFRPMVFTQGWKWWW